MFCRSCGKELSDKAVACIGCGMNPKSGIEHCPLCGAATKAQQIICTQCGGSLKGKGSSGDGWSTGAYIGLLVLSFVIPLFGWIYGGMQVRQSVEGSKRKKQAWHFVISGIVSAVIGIILRIA